MISKIQRLYLLQIKTANGNVWIDDEFSRSKRKLESGICNIKNVYGDKIKEMRVLTYELKKAPNVSFY